MGRWRFSTGPQITGFDLLEAIGIVGSLTFAAVSFRRDDESRRVENLLNLVDSHRQIWKELLRDQRLSRIQDSMVDLDLNPVTLEEQVFVTLLVTHLSAVFYAKRDDLMISPNGAQNDVWQFFSLPIPRKVWNRLKGVQNPDFAKYVEDCLQQGK